MNEQQRRIISELGCKFGAIHLLGFFTLVLLILSDVGICYVEEETDVIETDGDIILGGLFPIHKKSGKTENECGAFSEIPGYQYTEAMLYAIDEINADADLLPNVTLGAKIYDTCTSTTIAADRAKEFIKMTLAKNTAAQLAGVVGALSSGVSATVANFLRVFEIPQVSYSSTSVILSNKDIYSYFLRTVAPDSFQARAMMDIIRHFRWRYVATVNSAGAYGTKGMEIFLRNAHDGGVCIDLREELSSFPSVDEYRKVMERLVRRSMESNVSVIVLFCNQADSRNLLEAAKFTQNARRFTFIGSDGWSNRFDVTETSDDVAQGALTIMMRRGGKMKKFEDYFVGLKLENYPRKNKRFFEDFWESRFQCNVPKQNRHSNHQEYNSSCHGNESLANVSLEFSPVRVVINAVYAFAHALHNLQKELCPTEPGICAAMSPFQRSHLLNHLKNVSFPDVSLNTTVRFDRNGEVNGMYDIMNLHPGNHYVRVATWDGELRGDKITGKLEVEEGKLKWIQSSTEVPESFCSKRCELGAIRVPKLLFDFKCCWRCSPCEKLQIIVNNSCEYGPVGQLPDANRTGWTKREVLYPKWSDGVSVLLIVISLVSLLLTLATFVIFVTYRNNRIVKASGRELCCVMLTGIAMCFLTPFLFIAKPNNPLCYARNLVTGLALATCYAPLFMKINRIYRIFTSARSSVARPAFVSPQLQLLVTFALVSIQFMFTALWFIAKPFNAKETFYSDREELVLECQVDQLSFSVNLCYVIVLMVLCTAYAFKTRNFPKNFNESKYTGITMYITCAIWMIFFPFFLNTGYSFTHVYLISGACVTVGFITLIGLFAQKIYIVYSVREIRNEDLVMTTVQKRAVGHAERRMSEVDERC